MIQVFSSGLNTLIFFVLSASLVCVNYPLVTR
uniref:Uncharacterized protein n=1 Tax=Timema cristinae TaxID=61476 RepID=A0A7R9DQK6_TIMCR|nr:unnamed protein product [Timema cristinae]